MPSHPERVRRNYGFKIIDLERLLTHIVFKTECGHWHARPKTWNIKLGDSFLCYCSKVN